MTQWPAAKAHQVLAALLRIGWSIKRQSGSHKTLTRPGYHDFTFAFHDGDEIGNACTDELHLIFLGYLQEILQSQAREHRVVSDSENREDGKMAKILIVDDEPHIREMLEETLQELEDQGVELIFAGNGMDALEAVRQQKPDLVFLDVLMPKMNGLEVCNAIKKQLGMKDIHVVMLTTKGQDFENQKVGEVGADNSIMKPLDPDEVYRNAIRILGLSS